jgi:DNA polymerase-3 subunit beta
LAEGSVLDGLAPIEVEEVGPKTEVDPDAGDVILEFTIKRFLAAGLFSKAASVVPSKELMPVLKNFWVEADEDSLRVVATDLELSIISSTQMVTILKPGSAIFPADKIRDIVRECADDEMQFTVRSSEGKPSATIRVGKASWVLRLSPSDDFPALSEVGDVELEKVNRLDFLNALLGVRYAASRDANRTNLQMIQIKDEKVTASDGTRIQQVRLKGFTRHLQIPIGAVDDLVKLLQTTELETIGIGETDSFLVFAVGNDFFLANTLSDDFPENMESLILKSLMNNTQKLVVDHEELWDAVRRVRINADPETSAVVLDIKPGSVTVRSRDKLGNTSTEKINAGWDGPERRVAVNHKFLGELISMSDAKACEFYLSSDLKAKKSSLMIKDEARGSFGSINQMHPDLAGM